MHRAAVFTCCLTYRSAVYVLSHLQSGGVYVLSNAHGCDGERTYYDGCCMIAVNGEMVCQGAQFTIKDVVGH